MELTPFPGIIRLTREVLLQLHNRNVHPGCIILSHTDHEGLLHELDRNAGLWAASKAGLVLDPGKNGLDPLAYRVESLYGLPVMRGAVTGVVIPLQLHTAPPEPPKT